MRPGCGPDPLRHPCRGRPARGRRRPAGSWPTACCAEGPAPLVESMLPRVLGETTRRQRPQLVESVRRVMMSNPPRGIAAATRGMAQRPDMTAALGEIRCPTLVLVGAEDVTSTPAEMRGRLRRFPARSSSRFPPPATSPRWKTRRRSTRRFCNSSKTCRMRETHRLCPNCPRLKRCAGRSRRRWAAASASSSGRSPGCNPS